MRIIYDRPPVEEREVKCNNCKSKLGYVTRDIIVSDEFYECNKQERSIRLTIRYIKCPICHHHIIINKG